MQGNHGTPQAKLKSKKDLPKAGRSLIFFGGPVGIRTQDLPLRSLLTMERTELL